MSQPPQRSLKWSPTSLYAGIISFLAIYMGDTLQGISDLLDRILQEDPDCIIYEPMCPWGYLLSKILDLPTATFQPSFVMNKDFDVIERSLSKFNGLFSIIMAFSLLRLQFIQWRLNLKCNLPRLRRMNLLNNGESLNLVFLPRHFHPSSDSFDDRYMFVGPSILPETIDYETDFPLEKLDNNQNKPILYISLGTVWCDRPDFFEICFDAFKDTPWLVIVATWKKIEFDNIPSNFIVYPRVPQLKILEKTDVFINHGGLNSSMGAFYYGIPQIVVPQIGDEVIVANRMVELGCGLRLDFPLQPKLLFEAVETVYNNPTYRENITYMQNEINNSGGYCRAADEIQNWLHHINKEEIQLNKL